MHILWIRGSGTGSVMSVKEEDLQGFKYVSVLFGMLEE
jgi:hypothetical protein